MPVNSTHPQYNEYLARWTRCRDAYDGEDAVKARGEMYLPRLSAHASSTDPKYLAYKARAFFYGAVARTVDGLAGMATRKPYALQAPEAILANENDITATGISLFDFSKICVRDALVTGRYGILVDRTLDGLRGYFAAYSAENIINWRFDDENRLVLLVLREFRDVADPSDKYVLKTTAFFRELFLDDSGFLTVRIWKEEAAAGTTKLVQDGEDYLPTFRNKRLDYIPFVFGNAEGSGAQFVKPPLLDMVNVNFSHYRNAADLEHGRHFVALPTPWFSGVSAANLDGDNTGNAQITIGSETAILLPDPNAKAGMLEFTGQGLSALEKALESKQDIMAVLGARLLENTKRAAETAETTRLNKSGDTSIMASITASVSASIQRALEFFAQWEGLANTDVSFAMPLDMLDTTLDAATISVLLQAYQTGALSLDSFLHKLKAGEMLPDDISVEDEKERINNARPASGPAMNLDGDEGDDDSDGNAE